MPSAEKVSWAKLRVGVMAIAAMIILVVLIFLLTGNQGFFKSRNTLVTYMDDSAALAASSPVRLNGILIGKVKTVKLSGENRPNRIVRIDLEIEDRFFPEIPIDSVAAIGAENLLGTKFINIKKGKANEVVKPGAEIASLDVREFDDVVQQGYSILTALQGTLKKVDDIVATVQVGKGTIGKLLVDEELYNKVVTIADDVRKVSATLASDKGTIGKLIYDDKLYGDIRNSLARVDTLMEGLQQGQGTAGKLLKDPALYDETQKTIAEVRRLIDDLNAGKGSAGKLLKSDELHTRIVGTIGRVDRTIDILNSGQGTLGQLLVNPSLYDSLNGTTQEVRGLMQDFRRDPKKYLRIKLALF
jgi:phospholipid/cholesterol/gamma-HCH transport system substrate-binding protein